MFSTTVIPALGYDVSKIIYSFYNKGKNLSDYYPKTRKEFIDNIKLSIHYDTINNIYANYNNFYAYSSLIKLSNSNTYLLNIYSQLNNNSLNSDHINIIFNYSPHSEYNNISIVYNICPISFDDITKNTHLANFLKLGKYRDLFNIYSLNEYFNIFLEQLLNNYNYKFNESYLKKNTSFEINTDYMYPEINNKRIYKANEYYKYISDFLCCRQNPNNKVIIKIKLNNINFNTENILKKIIFFRNNQIYNFKDKEQHSKNYKKKMTFYVDYNLTLQLINSIIADII